MIGSPCEKCPENTGSLEGTTSSMDCVGSAITVTITFTATIPMTFSEFQKIRGLYIYRVAEALSLSTSAVSIVKTNVIVTGRRLLGSSISVITAVVAEGSMITNISISITSGVLQTHLNASGISVSNLSPPVVSVPVMVVPSGDDTTKTDEFTGIFFDDIRIWITTDLNYLFVLGGVIGLVVVVCVCIYVSRHHNIPPRKSIGSMYTKI